MLLDVSDPKLYNPLFFKLRKSSKRFVISYGGKGSSKSFTQAQYEIFFALQNPNQRILIIRKYMSTLEESIVELIKSILKQWKIYDKSIHYKNEKKFILPNGSQLICKGADDTEKLKSLTGISRIWIEEATELDESDFLELNSRLRGKTLIKPQLTLTFNPVDESHWIKKLFFDNKTFNINTDIIKTTCKDNRFIDKAYIEQLEGLKDYDYNRYRVEFLGEFGKLQSGGELYTHFSPNKHVKDVQYDPSKPLHISFDENVNPYLTCLIAQVIQNDNITEINILDEICLTDFNLQMVCGEFSNRYSNHKSGLLVYGDATSQKRDTKLEQGYNFYTLVTMYLKDFSPNLLISKTNPSVAMRVNWINNFLYKNDTIKLQIHSKCKETIKDFQYVKRASDGTKDKSTVRNKITGVSEQKQGHCTDSAEYLIVYALQSEYFLFQNGGHVFTPLSIGLRTSHRW
jgi:phage terminase large subunit